MNLLSIVKKSMNGYWYNQKPIAKENIREWVSLRNTNDYMTK